METIISPVDRNLLEQELTEEIFVRQTNFGNNKIYIFTSHNSPNLMQEVGRLREVTFRNARGGTGLAVDIDHYDTAENPFCQLIVWNPEDKEIIGGYRFIHGKDLKRIAKDEVMSPTSKLFSFSEKFIEEYLPATIELGRSFVQPAYQPSKNVRKGIYALDNIWDGLGTIIVNYPDIKYLFGKITMYPHFDVLAKDMLMFFMNKYFPDHENLIYPRKPLKIKTDLKVLENLFQGNDYDEDYKILIRKMREQGENIPPLFNAYMNLSSTMRNFGTALNEHFGNVEETGIIVTISDIYDDKKNRHITSYKKL